jgi:hypothetical protein
MEPLRLIKIWRMAKEENMINSVNLNFHYHGHIKFINPYVLCLNESRIHFRKHKVDSTAKTIPIDREAERYAAIALAPLR